MRITRNTGPVKNVDYRPLGDAAALPVGNGDTIEFTADLHKNFGLAPFVAAYPDVHPLAVSPTADLDWLKRKQDAGAAEALTQFFFEAETFLRFRDKAHAAGITLPLTPGIMPLHNLSQILRFAEGCGAKVPECFAARFPDAARDPEGYARAAVEYTLALCRRLVTEGAEALHFYALNQDEMVTALCAELREGAA